MECRSVAKKLHSNLLSSTSAIGLRARGFAVPLVVGAATALGILFASDPANAQGCSGTSSGIDLCTGTHTDEGLVNLATGALRVDLQDTQISDSTGSHGYLLAGQPFTGSYGIGFQTFTAGGTPT